MDITQMKYLLMIVDNGFNLTRSAEALHISQPALSKSVKDVEFKLGEKIFVRTKGRIVGLTKYGKVLTYESKKVYQTYSQMVTRMHELSGSKTGTVRIGTAPLIGSTIFNDAIMAFIKDNPGISLKLVEKGTYELQRMLLRGQIDLAVIVSPATVEGIYEDPIYQDTVRVWFNNQHRFNKIKGPIPFSEIEKEKIVTFTDDYMVTFQLNKHFRGDRKTPNYFLQTSSWDLILNLVAQDPTLIGIITHVASENYRSSNIISREILPRFPWDISLCHTMTTIENPVVDFARTWFLKYFAKYRNGRRKQLA